MALQEPNSQLTNFGRARGGHLLETLHALLLEDFGARLSGSQGQKRWQELLRSIGLYYRTESAVIVLEVILKSTVLDLLLSSSTTFLKTAAVNEQGN